MSDTFLKWLAGIAATVAVIAGGAAITTWADVRQLKDALAESKTSAVKGERIAALETEVANLKAKMQDLDNGRAAMWRVIGEKADRNDAEN